jgi:branched-subunit amino acid aminotransferase/4-amino-4-deoxychorismate lyase
MSSGSFRAWRWDGGAFVSHRSGIPLNDRGFRYGQHLFESIAVRNRGPLLIEEHLDLLASSAKEKGIPFTRKMAAALRKFTVDIILPDGMLRIYITAGEGAPASPVRFPGLYVTWEPAHFPTEEELRKGIALTVLKKSCPDKGWGIKSGNYESHLIALATARATGAVEGVVLDGAGRVISCAMGNLLAWLPQRSGSLLVTPPHDRGARAGALLGWVKSHHDVVERDLCPADLGRAIALAVTNSRLGVMPVAKLDGKKLPGISLPMELAQSYLRAHDLHGTA